MGINDRDYYRHDHGGSPLMGGDTPVCTWILAANIIVFILQLVITSEPSLDVGSRAHVLPESLVTNWLVLDGRDVIFRGQVWRLITYAFCHDTGSPWHIVWNMLFFWWFARELERMYGSREFGLFYFTSILIAGLLYLAIGAATGMLFPMLGASGGVMAVTMVYALYYPTHTIRLFGIIPIEIRWLVVFYVIADLYGLLRGISDLRHLDGVAHAAHLGGLAYGYLFKTFDLRFGRYLPSLNWRRLKRVVTPQPNLKVYAPPRDPNFDQQVDAILEKISTHGEASLSRDERAILTEASRRYKKS